METREIEVRFLEIDKEAFVQKLCDLGAINHGEVMLEEVIVYDNDLVWLKERRFARLRKSGDTTKLTYKEHMENAKDGARELELEVSDLESAVLFLKKIGLNPYRRQQKKRHTLTLNDVIFDIDTWPRVPSYVELEGPSMETIKEVSEIVGLDWSLVVYKDAKWVLENMYNIPMGKMRWLTFDRFE